MSIIKKKEVATLGKFQDLTGQHFGKLTVLGIGERKKGNILWNCLCECGNDKHIRGSDLKKGAVKSCGCLLRQKGREPENKEKNREIALLKGEYSRLKHQARRRNLAVTLSFSSFSSLVKSPCNYCGKKGSKSKLDYDKHKQIISDLVLFLNGIDRIDSTMGYTEENSVSCCTTCNTAKRDLNLQHFIDWLEKVYDFNFNK